VEGSGPAATIAVTDAECGIEVSQTSRATCKPCKQKIMKGEVGFYVSLLCFSHDQPSAMITYLQLYGALWSLNKVGTSLTISTVSDHANNSCKWPLLMTLI
jgi:hypothetical protein